MTSPIMVLEQHIYIKSFSQTLHDNKYLENFPDKWNAFDAYGRFIYGSQTMESVSILSHKHCMTNKYLELSRQMEDLMLMTRTFMVHETYAF